MVMIVRGGGEGDMVMVMIVRGGGEGGVVMW